MRWLVASLLIVGALASSRTVHALSVPERVSFRADYCATALGNFSVLQQGHETPLVYSPLSTASDPPGLVVRARAQGARLSDAFFDRFQIPKVARPFYDPETGEFRYANSDPLRLALENGDAKLQRLRMNWSSSSREMEAISAGQLRDMDRALADNPALRLWVVVDYDSRAKLEEQIANFSREVRARIELIDNRAGGALLVWAQDGSKPLSNGLDVAVPAALIQFTDQRYYNAIASLMLNDRIRTRPSIFRFEGGSIVVGERHIFVGSEVVQAAMDDFKISRREAVRAMGTEFGKPIFEVGVLSPTGAVHAPDMHADLSLAVVRNRKTGQEVVLLDSQRLALKLLGDPMQLDFEAGDEVFAREILLRRYSRRAALPTETLTQGERDLAAFLGDMDAIEVARRQRRLDALKLDLKAAGYTVREVPGLSSGQRGYDGRPLIFNYTNSIFSHAHAIVPHLGVRAWDEYVWREIESLGYDITPATVARKSLCANGGIRCLSETFRWPPR